MEYLPVDEDVELLDEAPQRVAKSGAREEGVTGALEQPGPNEAEGEVSDPGVREPGGEQAPNRVSARQRAANRENAKRSPGPRTAAGKRVSSQNAIKHGYYAEGAEPIRRGALAEDEEEFRRTHASVVESLHPRNEIERQLASTIASDFSTRGRLERYAALMLSGDGKANVLLASQEKVRQTADLRRIVLGRVRRWICGETMEDGLESEAVAKFLLALKNDGQPLTIEGVWDAEHQPQTGQDWRTAARLIADRLLPKEHNDRLRWIDDLDFSSSVEALQATGMQEEVAAARGVEHTYAQTIPKTTSLERQLVRLLKEYRVIHNEPLPEDDDPTSAEEN